MHTSNPRLEGNKKGAKMNPRLDTTDTLAHTDKFSQK